MNPSLEYEGFTLTARPQQLQDGRYSTEVRISRVDHVQAFYASNTWETFDEAALRSIDFGRSIIEGEVPGVAAGV